MSGLEGEKRLKIRVVVRVYRQSPQSLLIIWPMMLRNASLRGCPMRTGRRRWCSTLGTGFSCTLPLLGAGDGFWSAITAVSTEAASFPSKRVKSDRALRSSKVWYNGYRTGEYQRGKDEEGGNSCW